MPDVRVGARWIKEDTWQHFSHLRAEGAMPQEPPPATHNMLPQIMFNLLFMHIIISKQTTGTLLPNSDSTSRIILPNQALHPLSIE